jgi:glycosyltransferase involved in cell wall biosynthesis
VHILYFADIRFPIERANGIQTVQTCWALAAKGHRVTMLVRPDTSVVSRDPLLFYGLSPVPTLSIERARVAGSALARRLGYLVQALARAAGRRRADVILTRDLGVASLLIALPRSLRPAVVYESHGFAPEVGRALPDLLTGAAPASLAKQRRLAGRERRVWLGADGYVTITSALASDLASMFGERRVLAVVPDGARLDPNRRFVPPLARRSATAAYAGNLYPWKGVDVFLRALAGLPNVRGLIIGGHRAEPDLGRLEDLARSLSLAGRVTFTGPVDPPQVASRLMEADVLVLPNTAMAISARYTSPLKLFEYLASGRPIVASDLPALAEVLRHGQNAWFVAPGDPEALARGIRCVLDDADLAQRLARGAFDAAAEYSWDRRAERLECVFASVLDVESAVRPDQGRRAP